MAVIVESMLFAVGALAVTALGVPVAVRAARVGGWRTSGGDAPARERAAHVSTGFQPLDMGPDPMTWPSATPWPVARSLPALDWPSKSWNDENFGRIWRDGGVKEAPSEPAVRPVRTEAAPEPKARRAAPAKPAPAAPEGVDAKPKRAATPKPAPNRSPAAPAPQRPQAAPARPEPAAPPAAGPKAPPGRDEVEQLIASVGLAGTVQEVMTRTGWDFRQAAQYLAKVRAKG